MLRTAHRLYIELQFLFLEGDLFYDAHKEKQECAVIKYTRD